jgi:hypothetical protein
MRRSAIWVIAGLCVLFVATTSRAQLGLQLGGGVHYVKTVGDIKDSPEFDTNDFNLVGAAKLGLGILKCEGDVEWIPDYGGSSKSLWLPQVFVLGGGMFYGGVGMGIGYIDGGWFDHPFYALRLGVHIPLLPISVDVNADYRFMNSKVFEDVNQEDLDSITFGAVVWFGI